MDTKDQDKLKDEIIAEIKEKNEVTTLDLSKKHKMDHQSIVGIIKGLEIKEIVESEKMETKQHLLL